MFHLDDWSKFVEFLMDIDSLKLEDRQSYVVGGARKENTAEHSWHVVIAAWAIAKRSRVPLSMEKVLKLAAVHDLCELDYGDTFIHSAQRKEQQAQEAQCVSRLMREYAAVFDEIDALWREYEACRTPEAKLVRVADRLLPLLHNLANDGKTWREHRISRSQVSRLYDALKPDFPEFVDWVESKLDEAVASGWLRSG